MKKIPKEDIIILLVILLFGFVITYPLLIQMHFAPDTYQVVNLGYTEYAKQYFLKSGRIITAGTFFIADAMKISYKAYIIFMEILAIISLSVSTLLLYKLFLQKVEINNKTKQYLILISSFLIIFNLFALEFLLYAESGIICLSILFSILGLRAFFNSEKNRFLKAMICIIIATILYQGNINIFFTLSSMFSFIINKKDKKINYKKDKKINYKKVFKDIFLAGIILVIAFLITTLLIFVCTNYLRVEQERFSTNYSDLNILNIFKSFTNIINYILTYGFNFGFIGLYLYTIIITIFYMTLLKVRPSCIIEYLFIILISFCVCILPIYTMADIFINARMCMSIGALIGISCVYITLNLDYKYKTNKIVMISIAVILLIYTGYTYITISQSNIDENKVDDEVGYSIKQIVDMYEETNNVKIKKFAVINDTSRSFYTSEKIKNTFTERSTANYYCIKEVLQYYLNKQLINVEMDEKIYYNYFANRDWNEFSKEQIVIVDDTLYMCIY